MLIVHRYSLLQILNSVSANYATSHSVCTGTLLCKIKLLTLSYLKYDPAKS